MFSSLVSTLGFINSSPFTLLFFNLGEGEVLVIILVMVLFFGSKSLPDLARGLGRGIREFKDATNNIQKEIKDSASSVQEEVQRNTQSIQREINKATTNIPLTETPKDKGDTEKKTKIKSQPLF